LGWEGRSIEQSLLLRLLLPNAHEGGDDLLVRAFGHGVQDSALLVDQARLSRRGWK